MEDCEDAECEAAALKNAQRYRARRPNLAARRRLLERALRQEVAALRHRPQSILFLLSELKPNIAGEHSRAQLAEWLSAGKLVAGVYFAPSLQAQIAENKTLRRYGGPRLRSDEICRSPIFAFVVKSPKGGYFFFDNIGLRGGMHIGQGAVDYFAIHRPKLRGDCLAQAHWQRYQNAARQLGWRPIGAVETSRFYRKSYPYGEPISFGFGIS